MDNSLLAVRDTNHKSIVVGSLLDIALNCENKKIYGKLEDQKMYIQAVLDFISGMTDRFAIKVFNELLTY